MNIEIPKHEEHNIFNALGSLKSLHCFPLNIDVNYNLKYRMNHMLHKCLTSGIEDKYGYWSKRNLVVPFHEILVNHESQLNTSVDVFRYFANHNLRSPKPLYFQTWKIFYLLKTFITL